MNLSVFLSDGIRGIAATIGHFYLQDSQSRSFVLQLAHNARASAKARARYEKKGVHIPPFLIASIASQCNLRCPGCYARANGSCGETGQTCASNAAEPSPCAAPGDLTAAQWGQVFRQAETLGMSFVLLAGGEPLMRRDVLEEAAAVPALVFPIFTNGTLLDETYLTFFHRNRHLIPVLSIEGDAAQTDARRGRGVALQVEQTMARLSALGILFGVSITVTAENMEAVTEPAYTTGLREQGCGVVFFIEYVPAQESTDHLVLSPQSLAILKAKVEALRQDKQNAGINFLSFPGDEDNMGGCLAAGRGFFHINAAGGAEPCPFSPFSVLNVRDHPLLEVIQSPFFSSIRQISAAEAVSHRGGCTLFEHRDQVMAALAAQP